MLGLSGRSSLAVGWGWSARLAGAAAWGRPCGCMICPGDRARRLVALANVAVAADLMFLSPHDLALLGLLLVFALALSLAFGAVLAGR